MKNWAFFSNSWANYLQIRKIDTDQDEPTFPEPFGIDERDAFYRQMSFSGWGGSSGHDAPMIAY